MSILLTVTVPDGVADVMPPLELLLREPAAMLVSCELELAPMLPLVVADPLTPPPVVPALAVVLVPEFVLPVPAASEFDWLALGWLALELLEGYELLAVVEVLLLGLLLLRLALVVSVVPCTFTWWPTCAERFSVLFRRHRPPFLVASMKSLPCCVMQPSSVFSLPFLACMSLLLDVLLIELLLVVSWLGVVLEVLPIWEP
jgi:hypothetical protein